MAAPRSVRMSPNMLEVTTTSRRSGARTSSMAATSTYSAPDIAGQSKADPTAAILSAAMLCAHLGLSAGAAKIEQAVADDVLARQGEAAARSTTEIGDDVAKRVAG